MHLPINLFIFRPTAITPDVTNPFLGSCSEGRGRKSINKGQQHAQRETELHFADGGLRRLQTADSEVTIFLIKTD